MSQNLSNILLKEIEHKRIFTFYDVYEIARETHNSSYKVFKELVKLKKQNKIKSVWLDIEEDKVSPLPTWERGFILKTNSKSAPILSNEELEEILKEIE